MIIFLSGPATFLSRQKLQELKAKFVRDIPFAAYNLVTLLGDEATPELVAKTLKSSAFLGSKRMVILENIISKGSKKTMQGSRIQHST